MDPRPPPLSAVTPHPLPLPPLPAHTPLAKHSIPGLDQHTPPGGQHGPAQGIAAARARRDEALRPNVTAQTADSIKRNKAALQSMSQDQGEGGEEAVRLQRRRLAEVVGPAEQAATAAAAGGTAGRQHSLCSAWSFCVLTFVRPPAYYIQARI